MAERKEGWGSLSNARLAHYFRSGRSLCGKWMSLGTPLWESNQTLGTEPDKGTCRACWRKRDKQERDDAELRLRRVE